MPKKSVGSAVSTAVDPDAPKVFAFKVPGGRTVVIERLPLGDLTAIATAHDVAWSQLLSAQSLLYINGAAVEALYRKCCEVAGVEAPESINARVLIDAIDFVPDDSPDWFEDGLPKTAAPKPTP
jgi:hypothetical protein